MVKVENEVIRQCGIYKYVWNNEIIYIGKSNSDIEKRIQCHSREEKFQKYLSDVDIYFCFLPNEATTDIYELYYINKYHPILNISSKYDCEPVGVDVADIEWCKYSPSKYWCVKAKKKPSKVIEFNKSKILWLQGLKKSCKDISETFSELKYVIERSKVDASLFCNLLRKNDDYNSFATYADYTNKLLEIYRFIDNFEYRKEKWDDYSNSFSYMIKEANEIISDLKR